jgi:hypothetical protein
MMRSARTGLLRHDHPASRIRALRTGRRDQLQLFDDVLDLRRAPAWEASALLRRSGKQSSQKRMFLSSLDLSAGSKLGPACPIRLQLCSRNIEKHSVDNIKVSRDIELS